jgi:hypothetical protein
MGSFGVGTFELKRQFEEFKQQDFTRQQLAEVRALQILTARGPFNVAMTTASDSTGWPITSSLFLPRHDC